MTRISWDGDGSDSWDGDGTDSWDGFAVGGVIVEVDALIKIEAAFGVPQLQVPLDTDWVDLTARGRGYTCTRGRSHELDRTRAGTATIRLDNRDRALDNSNSLSPYAGKIVPGLQVRVTVNDVGRYYGYLQDPDQLWPSGPMPAAKGDAEVDFGLVDGFGPLNAEVNSYVSEIFADSPVGYWRLNDPEIDTYDAKTKITTAGGIARNYGSVNDAGVVGVDYDLNAKLADVTLGVLPGPLSSSKTVMDFLGHNPATPLSQQVIRGSGTFTVPPDWNPGTNYQQGFRVTYNASVYVALWPNVGQQPNISPAFWAISGPAGQPAYGGMWDVFSWSFWANPDTLNVGDGIAALYEYTAWPGSSSATAWRITVGAGGSLVLTWSSGYVLRSVTGPAGLLVVSGDWQEITISVDTGGGISWYRDGLLFGTTAGLAAHDPEFVLNLAALVIGADMVAGQGFDGKLAHFAVYPNPLSAARAASHHLARCEEIEAGDAGTQIGLLLDAAGWPSSLRNIDTTSTTIMQPLSPSGPILDTLLRIAEDSERGLFQMSAEGEVTFISRNSLTNFSTLATFADDGVHTPYTGLVVSTDEPHLYTVVTCTRNGGESQTSFDDNAIASYGERPLSLSNLSFDTEEDTANSAKFLLSQYNSPQLRPTELTVISYNALAQILALTIHGSRVTVVRTPPGGGTLTLDAAIEGLTESFAPKGILITTYALVPASGSGALAWELDVSRLSIDTAFAW